MIVQALWAVVGAGLALHIGSALIVAARQQGRRPATQTNPARPFVSLLRTVRELGPFEAETLASSFTQTYPAYEVVFCAEQESDPAVAVVRALIARHPQVPARLLVGAERIGVNPKLNNLAKGLRDARAGVIAAVDSNLMLSPGFLGQMVGRLGPGVGVVSSPPLGTRPGNFWGAVECAFLNTNALRWQLAADSLGGGFVHGKAMCFPRALIDAAGGVEALAGELGEDVAMTKAARREGLGVALLAQPEAQPIGRRSFAETWGRQLRWSQVRQAGYPALFAMEPAQGPFLPAAAVAGLVAQGGAPGWGFALLALAWYGTEWGLAALAGWPRGLRDLAAMPIRDAMLPAVWLATFGRREMRWNGREMELRKR